MIPYLFLNFLLTLNTIVKMKNSIVLYNPNHSQDKEAYVKEVLQGLTKTKKEIPFKFIYDDEGSRFITSINSTEVYYIWKCESQIF